MNRVLPIAGLVGVSLTLTGCAGALDTVTSRRFRADPFTTTYRSIHPEDALAVLRADPPRSGDERARAMLRLREPLAAGAGQEEQDAAVDVLAKAATGDPSPVVRLAAVEALGRFQDQRVGGILMLAYQNAHGRSDDGPALPTARTPGVRAPLSAPTGFAPEVTAAVRSRAVEALGRTGRPDVVPFLAAVAAGSDGKQGPEGADDRGVRLAAVRGLGQCRHPDAVTALAQVLSAEAGRDPAVTGRAHDGLVRLTGHRLPADPARWNEVVQAGVTVAPEPGLVDQAVNWVLGPP